MANTTACILLLCTRKTRRSVRGNRPESLTTCTTLEAHKRPTFHNPAHWTRPRSMMQNNKRQQRPGPIFFYDCFLLASKRPGATAANCEPKTQKWLFFMARQNCEGQPVLLTSFLPHSTSKY